MSSVVLRVLLAVCALVLCVPAEPAAINSYLAFDDEDNLIWGESTTDLLYGEYPDEIWCINYQWVQDPQFPDQYINVCTEVWLYRYSAATYGALYGPSGIEYSDYHAPGIGSSLVAYSKTDPEIGDWVAYGDHYLIVDTYSCPMTYDDWQQEYVIDYYNCMYVWTDPSDYLGSSSAEATTSCIHHGTVNNGYLSGDSLLPSDGWGFDTHSPNRWGCNTWLLSKIPSITSSWSYNHSFLQAGIGRISKQHGGDTDGSSHRNGLDVDVRYVRSDAQGPFDFDADDPSDYHQAYTNSLAQAFCDAGATIVGADSRAGLTATCAQVWGPPHNNHFHVRFLDPDGPNN